MPEPVLTAEQVKAQGLDPKVLMLVSGDRIYKRDDDGTFRLLDDGVCGDLYGKRGVEC